MPSDDLSNTANTIYVVIPVHNRCEITYNCLTSINEHADPNIEVIVVDDGSTDGTSAVISKSFPEVHLLRGNGELWWTGSINLGIKKAIEIGTRNDLILLMNDDLIIKSNYFDSLRRSAKKYPNSLIGSVVLELDDPDLIKDGGSHVNWLTAKYSSPNTGKNISNYPLNYIEDVDYLTGRGVVIPMKVFSEIGLYDDKTFKQCGDIEYPVRAKRNGYKLLVDFNVKVYSLPEPVENFNRKTTYSIRDFKKYFFSFRSNASFICRYAQAKKMIPNVFQRICFLCFDLVRISFHYILKLRRF